MEALWPDADPDASANRLRTVLNRLRDAAGDMVVREDRQLCLGPEVHTDVQAFADDARRALLAGRDADPARPFRRPGRRWPATAASCCPEDPYEPWAELPRQRLRSQALALLDLCAEWAAGPPTSTRRCAAWSARSSWRRTRRNGT